MTLPSVETARGWSGLTAVDSDDQPLGRITDIYLDRDTGLPEWALVATPERRRSFVPLAGAARKGDRIVVAVHKAAVSDAPAIRPGRELSDGDAARLYGYYVGPSDDRNRGARRAPGRGPVARLRAAAPSCGKVGGGAAPGGQGPRPGGRAVGPGAVAVAGRVRLGADRGRGRGPGRARPAPPGTGRPGGARPGAGRAAGRLSGCPAASSRSPVARVARRTSPRRRAPLA
jgi:PRC-barrel domain